VKRIIESAGGALEAVQFMVYVCAAIALVAVGPFIWLYRLFTAERTGWAMVVSLIWITSVVVVAREVWRKAITVVSFGVFLTWLVVLVWVFHDWFAYRS
jgi:hypothetical protein